MPTNTFEQAVREIEVVTNGAMPDAMKVDMIRDLCAAALFTPRVKPTTGPRDDPTAALRHATTHPREKAAPHHVRCTMMKLGDDGRDRRCIHADGHPSSIPHVFA